MLKKLVEQKREKHLSSSPLCDFKNLGFDMVDNNQYSALYRDYNCDVGYDANLVSGSYYWVRVFFNVGSSSKKELHEVIDKLEKNTNKESSQWTFTSVNLFFPFVFRRPKFEQLKNNLDRIIDLLHSQNLPTMTMEEANQKVLELKR